MKPEKRKAPKLPKSYKGHSKKYPMFGFRIPDTNEANASLKRIKANLEVLSEHFKEKFSGKENKIINKNDILIDALDKGLILVKKEENI